MPSLLHAAARRRHMRRRASPRAKRLRKLLGLKRHPVCAKQLEVNLERPPRGLTAVGSAYVFLLHVHVSLARHKGSSTDC